MRILFISPHPGFGGASTANRNMATMMASIGHDVVYMDEYLPSDIIVEGCVIDRTPIHANKCSQRVAKDYFERNHFDIIFLGVPIIGLYYYSLFSKLKKRGVRICMVFHSLSLSNGLMAKIDEHLTDFAAKVATHLLFVSEFTKMSWRKYRNIRNLSNNSFVVYNAIKKYSWTRKKGTDVKRISFVGRLSPEKDPDLFCKLAVCKRNNGSALQFNLYGDGPLMEQLKKEYSDEVTFHGFETDINKIYSNTDILVMTSIFENCPMAVLEAASFGIPCIVPKVGGIPEIIKHGQNGLLYDERNPKRIAELLDEMIDNYSNYSDNAFKISNGYSFEEIQKVWNSVIYKIIS